MEGQTLQGFLKVLTEMNCELQVKVSMYKFVSSFSEKKSVFDVKYKEHNV